MREGDLLSQIGQQRSRVRRHCGRVKGSDKPGSGTHTQPSRRSMGVPLMRNGKDEHEYSKLEIATWSASVRRNNVRLPIVFNLDGNQRSMEFCHARQLCSYGSLLPNRAAKSPHPLLGPSCRLHPDCSLGCNRRQQILSQVARVSGLLLMFSRSDW